MFLLPSFPRHSCFLLFSVLLLCYLVLIFSPPYISVSTALSLAPVSVALTRRSSLFSAFACPCVALSLSLSLPLSLSPSLYLSLSIVFADSGSFPIALVLISCSPLISCCFYLSSVVSIISTLWSFCFRFPSPFPDYLASSFFVFFASAACISL